MAALRSAVTARNTRSGQGWCLPQTIRRFGEKLMDQQLWCWGKDVQYLDGNLLMRFGFERHRDQETKASCTCYRLEEDQLNVSLWGFGMFFGSRDLGGLYLGRFEFWPSWTLAESLPLGIHGPNQLPVFARPRGQDQWKRARKLWNELAQWISRYEVWIAETVGIAFRSECVETWLRPFVRADRMSAAWRFLSCRGWEQQDQPLNQTLKQFIFPVSVQ